MTYDVRKAFLADQVYNTDNMPLGTALTDPTGGRWVLALKWDSKTNGADDGYQGALFKNLSTGEYVFSSRGTELKNEPYKDLVVADLQMGLKTIPDQMASQRMFFNEAKKEVLKNQGNPATDLSAVGDSLGASLVNLLGAENPSLKVDGFNTYGVGNMVPAGTYSNITNHVLARDPVSVLPGSNMIGKTYMYNEPTNPSGNTTTEWSSHLKRSLWQEASVFLQKGKEILINVLGLLDGINLSRGGDDALMGELQKLFVTAKTIDPIVLDLDGDGVESGALSKTGVYFNLDAKGLAENTGWVGKDDGLLVRDLDGDGRITSGRELFGNHALLKSGQEAANGFEALKELDSNADGVVDAKDSAFGTLRVWKDADSDGVTDAGELLTLQEAGVKSLKVAYANGSTTDAQGNVHRQVGSFTTATGASRAMDDVWFAADTARTIDQDTVAVGAQIEALPALAGMGNVRDLHQAMARDASGKLQSLVEQWRSGTTAQREAVMDQLIYQWAGVQGVDPSSRGAYIDGRKLAAVEAFLGSDFMRSANSNPATATIAQPLLRAYALLSQSFVEQLYWQTDGVALLGKLSLAWVAPDPNAIAGTDAATGHYVCHADALAKTLHDQFASKKLSEGAQDLLLFIGGLKNHGGDVVLQALQSESASYDGLFNALLQIKGDVSALGLYGVQIGTFSADRFNAASGTSSILLGFGGDDVLYGNAQADTLDGGADNDDLYGDSGDDTLSGGTGNDTLNGGYGNDTYLFNLGDGADTLIDYDYSSGNIDVLRLGAGLNVGSTQLGRSGNDLVLNWSDNASDKVTLQSYFSGNTNRIETIAFADGTQWALADVAARLTQNGSASNDYINGLSDYANRINGLGGDDNLYGGSLADVINGGAGNDYVYGDAGADTLSGGSGSDTLNGGYGSDTYIFNQGDGADTLIDYDSNSSNIDVLRLGAGLNAGSTQLGRSGSDLVLSWSDNASDKVTLQSYFSGSSCRIETIAFADGTQWALADVAAKITQNGSGNADSWSGFTDFSNRMNGFDGNDSLYGGSLADVINGGAGNDYVYGDAGADTLSGGSGSDTLNGGYGSDTYIFNQGDGADTLIDYDSNSSNADVLRLGAGLNAGSTQLGRSGSDLVLSWSDNASDKVTLQSYFSGNTNRIETIAFADGTQWALADVAARLTQNGSASNDYINGLSDYANRINGLGGDDNLYGGNLADTLSGGTGSDTLNGGSGNDTYIFSLGDGADILYDNDYNNGNVDVLRLGAGLSVTTAQLGRSGSDLVLSWSDNASDKVTLQSYFSGSSFRIETIAFADGTQWALADVAAKITQNGSGNADSWSGFTDFSNRMNGFDGNDSLYGGSLADVINGGAGNDYVYGDAGADTLSGGTGNDTINGGYGNDTYIFNLGDGTDTLIDYDSNSSNADVLRLGAGLNAGSTQLGRSGSDLVLSWSDNASDKVTLQSYFSGNTNRIETIAFADGTQWALADVAARLTQNGSASNDYINGLSDYVNRINGLGGDDNLYGGNLADTLSGGTGSDTLNGGSGNDTYIFSLGDGADILYDNDYNNGNVDVLRLGAGLSVTTAQLGRSGSDLVLSWSDNASDKVTLQSYFSGSSFRIETIAFADGTQWALADVAAKITQNGSGNADSWSGFTDFSNRMNGFDGNDSLYGGSLADVINGGAGNDYVYGDAGADTLSGGTGSDTINGGYGNDTYLFNLGDGSDTLVDWDYSSNVDTVKWDASVTSQQLWFSRSGNNLQVSVIGTTDKVTVQNWYLGAAYQVEQFKAGDGKTLLNTQVDALVNAMAAFAPPAAGQTTLAANYQSALSPALAANWK